MSRLYRAKYCGVACIVPTAKSMARQISNIMCKSKVPDFGHTILNEDVLSNEGHMKPW